MSKENELELPTKIIKSSLKSPKNLIIISKPKVGKTSLLAKLDDCLLLDFEEGSDYVDAMKIKVRSIKDLKTIGKKIVEAKHPYSIIAVDTVTALETMCLSFAEEIYAETPMGKNWFLKTEDGKLSKRSGKAQYKQIIGLPNGGGYLFLRQAFTKVIDYIHTLAPMVILSGHVKDILLEKDGAEISSSEIDLTGKLKRMTTSASDAIGYLYRKGEQNILSFKTTDEVACGARPEHLRNKEIIISEIIDSEYITHWDKIYID